MRPSTLSDEVLLTGRDPAGFEEFYVRHVDGLLGFFARRTRDPDLAADLTAETFAAALASRARYRPVAGSASAWLFGIDPAGRRIERRVSVQAGGLEASGVTADDRRVYVLDRDGRLLTVDGRTGTKSAPVALHVPARWLAGAAGNSVIVTLDGGFAAVDRTTGRTLWQTHVAARGLDAAGVDGTSLWAHGAGPSGRDTVWRLDARSGQVTGRLALPEFGVSYLTVARGRLWVLTPGGRLQIVSGG